MARTGTRGSATATHNVEWVEWNDKELIASVRRSMAKRLRSVGKSIAAEMRQDLSGPAGSPPGGPPGRVDGDLIAAVGHSVRQDRRGITMAVGVLRDPVQFAKGARLAGGFVGRDRDGRVYNQAPRPWAAPVVERNSGRIVAELTQGGFE